MPVQQSDIETIFIQAAAIDASGERRAFLDEHCGEDAQLRQRIEALLRAHEDAGSFLDGPPEDVLPTIAINSKDTVDEGLGVITLDFLDVCDTPDRLGKLGQHEVIEVLGRGGMGIVLRAHDTKLNRVVAIKVMAPELAANPMAVKRFLREAVAAAAVTHDHVVSIHAIEDKVTPPYIVMEFVDGLSLQEKIDKSGALELREILRIGMQAAAGLAAAHKQGLVHRDIKPANILLENGVERVKITDFGLARAVDDVNITRTGVIAGTPQYMSPEQAQGEGFDHRSDLFALGSVLYAMCTGRAAFRADNPMAVMRRVCDDHPRAICEINADVPVWLEAVVEKLLAKDANERFQTAEEVSELLANWLAHTQQPSLVPPPVDTGCQPVSRAAKNVSTAQRPVARKGQAGSLSLRRWPLIATAAALLLGIIAFGAVIMVATNRGMLEVRSEVGDVQVSVTKNGEEVTILDLATGSRIKWLPSDDYEIKLVGEDNDIKLDKSGFEMTRLGKVIVTARWRDDDAGVIKRFAPDEETITKDGVAAADGGWKITADKTRTVRLFETRLPELKPGPFFYHATIKTEDVKERAYLEMWVRFPGQGEFFSKGFHNAVSGTTGWSEYQIPFLVNKEGQKPDFVKLNIVIEGGGTAWVKDLALRGRVAQPAASEGGSALGDFTLASKFEGHTNYIDAVAFTPDGSRILTGSVDKSLRVWDAENGNLLATIRTEAPVSSLAVSPDGRYVATGLWHAKVILWDLESGREIRRYAGVGIGDTVSKLGRVLCLDFSPDGSKLICGGDDGIVHGWNVETGAKSHTLSGSGRQIQSVAFSPDGNTILSAAYDNLVILHDDKGSKKLAQFRGAHPYAAFSPNGKRIVAGNSIWDIESERRIVRLEGFSGRNVRFVQFTPDGQFVVMGCPDRTLRLFGVSTGKEVARSESETHVTMKLAVSPDGRHVVTGGGMYRDAESGRIVTDGDFAARLWRLPHQLGQNPPKFSETRRLPGPTTRNSAVAWPTATRIVSGTQYGVAVWDAESGELLTELFDRLPADKKPEEDGRDIAPRDGCGLAVTADGKLAATGHYRGMVCIWDIEARKQLHRIPAHWRTDQYAPSVYGLAFTPDGKHLVTAAVDGQIRVWNVATGEMVAEQKFGHRIRAMALHPNGKHVLAGSYLKNGKSRLALLDWETGKVVHEFEHRDTGFFALDISPDGRLAVSGSNEENPARVWDLETGKQLHLLGGQTDTVESVAFTPDGRHIVCGTNDRKLRVYDVQSGRETYQHTADTYCTRYVAISPDGKQFATGGGKYWDYKKNGLMTDGDNDLRISKLSPDASDLGWQQLFNGRDLTGWKTHPDRPGGWRVHEGVLIGNSDDRAYLFSERGDLSNFHLRAEVKINAKGNSGIFFRAPFGVSGQHVRGYEAQIMNGQWFWAENQLDENMTGSLVKRAPFKEKLAPPDEWFTLEVIANDNRLVVKVNGVTTVDYVDEERTFRDGHIALQALTKTDAKQHQATVVQFRKIETRDLDVPSVIVEVEGNLEQVGRFPGHTDWISDIVYTSDGSRIVTSGYDERIRVWDAATGKLLKAIDTKSSPTSIALSPDNRFVVAGMYQANVVMWDLETEKIVRPFVGHEIPKVKSKPGRILSVAFSPDGKTVASSGDDGTVRLWNVETGKQMHKLEMVTDLPAADLPKPPVETVAFSPDGKLVLASDYNRTVALWNVSDGKPIKSLRGHGHSAISPDGKWIASGHHLFNAETFEHVHHLRYEELGSPAGAPRFTPDSQHVVLGKSDGSLWVYEVASGKDVAIVRCSKRVTNVVAISPDGQHIASGGGAFWSGEEQRVIRDDDYALRIWQLPENLTQPKNLDADARRLKEIGSAFHNYLNSRVDGQESFPPSATTDAEGKPLLSWRVRLLPYLGEHELYDRFHHDEPWDSPHNDELLEKMPNIYATLGAGAKGKTSVMVFVGDDALFGGKKAAQRDRALKPFSKRAHRSDAHLGHTNGPDAVHEEGSAGEDGEFGGEVIGEDQGKDDEPKQERRRRGGPSIGEVTDGFSNTILAIQAGADKAVPWTKPEDLPFDPENPFAALGKPGEEGWLAVFGDGSVQTIPANITPATLQRLINPSDGQAVEFPEGEVERKDRDASTTSEPGGDNRTTD